MSSIVSNISYTVHIFKDCFLKICFFSYSGPKIFTSAALIYTKLSSFIPIYIMKILTEGFVQLFYMAVDSIFWLLEW